MNDGISSSLILFSSVFILTIQYLIYRDKINLLQGFGLGIIILGVIIISVFKADEEVEIHITQVKGEAANSYAKVFCVINGKLLNFLTLKRSTLCSIVCS